LNEGREAYQSLPFFVIRVMEHHDLTDSFRKEAYKMPEETKVKKEPVDTEMTAQQIHDLTKKKEEYFNTHDSGIFVFIGKGEEDGRSKG
jgi:hypothetical protein